MKQLEHSNLIPFYGVWTTIVAVYLVFPWYENGNIMEYLTRSPATVSRFTLVSTFDKALHPRHLLVPMDSYLV